MRVPDVYRQILLDTGFAVIEYPACETLEAVHPEDSELAIHLTPDSVSVVCDHGLLMIQRADSAGLEMAIDRVLARNDPGRTL